MNRKLENININQRSENETSHAEAETHLVILGGGSTEAKLKSHRKDYLSFAKSKKIQNFLNY